MSSERTSRLLLRLYPAPWRARYGEELAALIVETSAGRVPWRTRVDVALGALRERLRAAAGGGAAPERARGGALLVLAAWALFVVGGSGVQKVSEHWQAATPVGSRGVPAAAFDVLVVAAAAGSALVLAGIGAALPSLLAFLRAGGWASIRRRILVAGALTALLVPATAGLAAWAHTLNVQQRNGHDLFYGGIFLAWVLLAVCCLAAWTAAATGTARRLDLPPGVLRLEAWLAGAVALAMVVMTSATAVWWGAVAEAAPGFFGAAPFTPQLVVAVAFMLAASSAGVAGAVRARRALG
ncbi:MAG TPA: hypothetical protein VFA19_01225 [Gaiellaceae bacterium]|nr:hypothetical protein [Gaiellaceae bacterium]